MAGRHKNENKLILIFKIGDECPRSVIVSKIGFECQRYDDECPNLLTSIAIIVKGRLQISGGRLR